MTCQALSVMAVQLWHTLMPKNTLVNSPQNQLPQVLVVGAEGGFIPYEIQLLDSVGVQAASLGKRILRTEAAVNALLGRWL